MLTLRGSANEGGGRWKVGMIGRQEKKTNKSATLQKINSTSTLRRAPQEEKKTNIPKSATTVSHHKDKGGKRKSSLQEEGRKLESDKTNHVKRNVQSARRKVIAKSNK